MIKQFTQGLSTDETLEEDYLDWYFLSYFGKGQSYWKNLPEDKVHNIMILESMKEERFWNNWVQIFKQMFK